MKAFADLYRRLDAATSTRAKQTAMVEAFAAARSDPAQWASAAWMVYFLAGGKPRQTVPTRLLRRLAVQGSGLPEWLVEESYSNVGDLAETLALLLPEGAGDDHASLDVWMRERLLPLPLLDEEERYGRITRWVGALPQDQRLVFFKLITGELRVGVLAASGREGARRSRGRRREPHGAADDRLRAGAANPDRRRFRRAGRGRRPRRGRGARRRPSLSLLSRAVLAAAACGHGGRARRAAKLDR